MSKVAIFLGVTQFNLVYEPSTYVSKVDMHLVNYSP